MLAAGIDVFSTVNVQHLESLNDQVAELTGVRVRETFPDSVLSRADEVVLVDVTPPALIERLRHGKVYKPERVPAALNGFFRIENLEALREVALRQVAEGVEAKRLVREPPPRPRRARGSLAPGRAAGGRRAAARDRHAAGLLAARRAARLALGAAARRGARHPHRAAARPRRRGAEAGRAARRAAPPRLAARRDRAGRGGRRRGRGGRAGRARARDDVRADGRAGAAPRPRPARASRSPSGCCGALPGVDLRIVADRAGANEAVVSALGRARSRSPRCWPASRSPRDRAAAPPRGRRADRRQRPKILFPFVGAELSERALQATLRLARAEHAVVVPAYLATVPLPLTLDAPVGRACDEAFAVFEAIEQPRRRLRRAGRQPDRARAQRAPRAARS